MVKRITIDRAGRIIIPKPVRKYLKLEPGDVMELKADSDKITLEPFRLAVPLKKESGIWVFRSSQSVEPEAISELIDRARDARSDDLLR